MESETIHIGLKEDSKILKYEEENSTITSPNITAKPCHPHVKIEENSPLSTIDVETNNSNSYRSFQSKCSNFRVFKMTKHSLNRREMPKKISENLNPNNFKTEIKTEAEEKEKAKIFSNFQNSKDASSMSFEQSLNFSLLQTQMNIPFNSNRMTMILLQSICRIYQQILKNKEHIRISETLLR